MSGVALTKLDGSAKGGVAIAIAHELAIPVKLVGVGEGSTTSVPSTPATTLARFSPSSREKHTVRGIASVPRTGYPRISDPVRGEP